MDNKMQTIVSDKLTVQINPLGASLWSIRENAPDNDAAGNCGGTEYLWQGDPKYWTDKAPNLFPYIARMTNKRYILNGQEYGMDIHGFAKVSSFEVVHAQENAVTLRLKDSEETQKQYPYHFLLDITYSLQGNKLDITFHVENQDEKVMYFGIGGHPGFNVPMEEGLGFEDYVLEFAGECKPQRISFSADCFVEGDPVAFPLEADKVLPLHHDLFDDDAIILTDMDSQVTLRSAKGSKAVRVTYPDMKYLGFWHRPHTDAPYVCIEPWSSLPSRKGIVEDLATQPGLMKLEPGAEYNNTWSIEIL